MEFVRDCLLFGPREAVEKRVPRFRDLTFMRQGGVVEVEFWLDMGKELVSLPESLLCYRLAIREDTRLGVSIEDEVLKQYPKRRLQPGKRLEFASGTTPRRLLGKTSKNNYYYQRESRKYQDTFTFGMEKPALSFTPPDEARYPTANAVKQFLMQGIRYIQLNSRAMTRPCPATSPVELQLDGSNLARVVGYLLGKNNGTDKTVDDYDRRGAIKRWTNHLRYAMDDIKEIGWEKRDSAAVVRRIICH